MKANNEMNRERCACGHYLHEGERCRSAISVLPMKQCPCTFSRPGWGQNAAESLPAAPEQEATSHIFGSNPEIDVDNVQPCAMCGSHWVLDFKERCPSHFCEKLNATLIVGWQTVRPVAPVGATEKVCEHCGHVLSPLGNCSNCEEPAEPKPTPSTEPTWVPVYVERAICDLIPDKGYAREIARVAWAWDDEHVGYENSLYRWQNEAIRQRRDLIALQEQIEHERGEPQPDSSSIPDTVAANCNCWHVSKHSGRRFAGDHLPDCPARDSSSISTEQTFEEVWKSEEAKSWVYGHLMETYPIAFRYVAQTFWNAAKGQSNGR